MTEKEKASKELLYNANYDSELIKDRELCKDLCFEYNNLKPSMLEKQHKIIKKIFKKTDKNFMIVAPFWCDYGYNIEIGENFYANHNCIFLDGALVSFGANVFIAPNCSFSTTGHPINFEQRNKGFEYSYPIIVGNNVWFGVGVNVLPGVTIGDNVVVGSGSIVNKDIPSNVVVAGNPAKIIRNITEEDRLLNLYRPKPRQSTRL